MAFLKLARRATEGAVNDPGRRGTRSLLCVVLMMLPLVKNVKVGNIVVMLVAVLVMHMLSRQKRPAEVLHHHPSVFFNPTSIVEVQNYVPLRVDISCLDLHFHNLPMPREGFEPSLIRF